MSGEEAPLPADADVAARHPELPGFALLLDGPALGRAVAPLIGGRAADLERLRIKPGTSVTAVLRVQGSTARLYARALVEESWPSKRDKDLRSADRAGLGSLVLPEVRLLVVPGAGDRHLPALWRLRPDTGAPVAVAGRIGRATTLSHNPSRRWVGRLDTDTGPLLLRLHGAAEPEPQPWTPGRQWRPGDPMPALADLLASLPCPVGAPQPSPGALRAAAAGLGALHEPWARRAFAVVDAVAPELACLGTTPAHGDLSPDQLIVDDGTVTVLDWDRAGLWPPAWDAASWIASRLLAGVSGREAAREATGLAAQPPAPAVLAAAAILRSPEPFRRRHPCWAAATERLLRHAEEAAA